jgi:hypothetical protein
MIRHTLTAAVAALGIAAVLPLSASAAKPGSAVPDKFNGQAATAQAVETCTLSIATRVAIGRPDLYLQGKITGTGSGQGTCTHPDSQSGWNLHRPGASAPVTSVQFDRYRPGADGRWHVPDVHPLGNMTFDGDGCVNADLSSCLQNQVPVAVRLAAGAWISSSRKADVVTLRGTSLLYSVTTNKFFKRSAAGVFQYREVGTTTWKNLKSVTTNSAGEVAFSYRYSKTRDYRFALYSTPISWDLGSATTTR